ncbi:uncharacterized protein LOC133339060 [Lethenteron reissneri]|uniref:uncharacterized protein LOC133339060 n=1 Tax=Lethenteron reissneri TaxID=7753 RepID=UPI002AB7A8A6|nr:uncharacterized protein LOC133339060 [Lethenteron reissneri]
MNITLIHVLAAVIWLAMSVEGLIRCYAGSAALGIPETHSLCAAEQDSCVTMELTESGIHYQARTCATRAQCDASDFKDQMKQYILDHQPTFVGTVDSTSCCREIDCNRANSAFCHIGSADLKIADEPYCGAGQDSCVTMQLTQNGIRYLARTCATKAQCDASTFKDQMKQYILRKLPKFVGTVDGTSCCQENFCNYVLMQQCYYGSDGLGVAEKEKLCLIGQDSCVTALLMQGDRMFTGKNCTTQAQCNAPDFKMQMRQSVVSMNPSFTGIVKYYSCCQSKLCNGATGKICYYGSAGLGITEEYKFCATGEDSCLTTTLTQGGKTFQFRGCGVTAACATSDYKTEIKQYITGIASSFTGTVNNYTCCQTDLCNGVIDGRTCRFGSSGLGVPEVDQACAPGEDSCVTAVLSQGGQQLIGRGCATTAQCAAADFKEQLKQYIVPALCSASPMQYSFTRLACSASPTG